MGWTRWWAAATLVWAAVAPSGCHRGSAVPRAPELRDVGALARKPGRAPDLTRPFNWQAWAQTSDNQEPLTIARYLARSAGGSWIVLAPKPLDDIKWQPGFSAGPSLTVAAALEAIRKAGTPLAWETRNDHTLLYFGAPAAMTRLHVQPPQEIVGLYLAAETGAAMLQTVADLWQLKIEVEPGLFDARDALAAARKRHQADEEPRGALAMFYNPLGFERRWGGSALGQPAPSIPLEFQVVERLDLQELMPRLASYFGGDCRAAGGGRWELTRLSNPQKLAAAVTRLKSAIEEKAGTQPAPAPDNTDGGESASVIPAPGDEVAAAFDSLGVLGAPAVPTLAGFLDAEKPALAQASMRELGEMRLPKARRALLEFGRRLQGPLKGTARVVRPALQAELVRVISRDDSPEAVVWLAAAARDEKLLARTRAAARMALLSTGHLSSFEAGARAKELEPAETTFVLRDPPGGPPAAGPPADAITPLATMSLPGGETWAVFVSGRYGDENDIWLARGRDHRWVEFLFTGQVFPRAGYYATAGPPQPGSCVIRVKGDRVEIAPPHSDLAAEMQRLQKALTDPTGTPQKRQKLMQRYSQIAQQVANKIQRPVILSLAKLRKDTDHDGLPDVVEARLGLDPAKADTDGDGIPDGKDANPLAKPNPAPSDRERLLQAVFSALYGGDPSPDPILVMLEPQYWQEFYGARGRVLCISKDDDRARAAHLGAMRLLQFGGPADADATILRKDGPCLFNDDRTKAEIHFWQWGRRSAQPYAGWRQMDSDDLPVDYLARFERRGDWKLISIKPWKFDTADRAMVEFQQRIMMGGAYRGMVD